MTGSVMLRSMTGDDLEAAIAVGRSLPEWFNAPGLEQISVDLHNQIGAVAELQGGVVGFVTWLSRAGVGEWRLTDTATASGSDCWSSPRTGS